MKCIGSKTCGQCKHFTGAGDWNLCCTQKHPTQEEKAKGKYSPWGHLCYEDTEACDFLRKRMSEYVRMA